MPSAFAHLLAHDESRDDHLAHALREAVRGVGRTAPNPPVGAVVVRGDERGLGAASAVIGAGFHARAGERHGEIVALDDAKARGHDVTGATLYVTLEPCCHQGRTPPCVDRILADKIARVVVGAVDPNPRVNHKGIEALRAAGVHVDVASGPTADACAALIAPFARALVDKAPYVVLKLAASLDGRIACGNGASRWITGPESRALVHALRDCCDAVLVGAGTVLNDDPALTVRDLPASSPSGVRRAARNPLRVVVDGALRTSLESRVYARADGEPAPVVIHGAWADASRTHAFDRAGVRRLVVDAADEVGDDGGDARDDRSGRDAPRGRDAGPRIDLAAAFQALVPLGVMAVLVEAGPSLATPLVQQRLVDELWWFQAPMLLGQDAIPAVRDLGLAAPADAPAFRAVHRAITGGDALSVLMPSRG